jgi:hypothetical protein
MGILAIGGMLSSTALTLLVVPVVYTLIDDAVGYANRLFGALHRRTPPLGDAASTGLSHE